MARNEYRSRGNDSSRSASRERKKKRKDCSRSRSRGAEAGKYGKKHPSPDRAVKSRGKKCSPSRSRSRNNKRKGRSRSGQRNRSPSRKRAQSPDRKRRSPSPRKGGAQQTGKVTGKQQTAAVKPVAPPSPSRNRASPSYDRGERGAAQNARARGSEPSVSRSRSASSEACKKGDNSKKMEAVTVTLESRPFGMAPWKDEQISGYVVSKVAEDKPAGAAGVRQGWRLVTVAGKSCRKLDLEEIQVLLKECGLPASLEFEREVLVGVAAAKDEDGEEGEDEDEEIDIRIGQRMTNQFESLDDLPVQREPKDLPEPIKDWQDAVDRKILNKSLMEKLQTAGLTRPTVIQRHALPIVLHGGEGKATYDLLASAQTGSGKTFAFLIPTVGKLILHGAMPRPFFPGSMAQASPLILILSPTRELAMQTNKEIDVLVKGSPLTACAIYGGESIKFQQQKLLTEQKDIVCATPGRLVDLIDARKMSLSFVQVIVLDEADQMFSQGLEVMCTEILTGRDMPYPDARQSLLFSATMPEKIRDLSKKVMREAQIAKLLIGNYDDDKGGACAGIKQILRWVPDEKQRIQAMIYDLQEYWVRQGKQGRVVVFANQRLQAGYLHGALINQGWVTLHLHGKLEQHIREEVFTKFRNGQAEILVATNVASRGLDFQDIKFVVQYNLPSTIDTYTHRIGRTGRIGQVGSALSYVGPKDKHLYPKLIEFLEMNDQDVPSFLRPRERRSPPRRGKGGYGGGYGRSRSRSRGKGGKGGYRRW